ncbi:hypothetical protein MRX96_011533 [Rhipicephalus microplus]
MSIDAAPLLPASASTESPRSHRCVEERPTGQRHKTHGRTRRKSVSAQRSRPRGGRPAGPVDAVVVADTVAWRSLPPTRFVIVGCALSARTPCRGNTQEDGFLQETPSCEALRERRAPIALDHPVVSPENGRSSFSVYALTPESLPSSSYTICSVICGGAPAIAVMMHFALSHQDGRELEG